MGNAKAEAKTDEIAMNENHMVNKGNRRERVRKWRSWS